MSKGEEESWRKETIAKVMKIVCSISMNLLSQRDICSLLLVSPSCYRALLSLPSLWQVNYHTHKIPPFWLCSCWLIWNLDNFVCRFLISAKWAEQDSAWFLRSHWSVLVFSFSLVKLFGWFSYAFFGLQDRYRILKTINLEFARDVEDEHLIQLKSKVLFLLS